MGAPSTLIAPTAIAFQMDGTTPGSTSGPDDLVDPVQSSTVNWSLQEITNSMTYLYSLLKGINAGPLGGTPTQPPAISGDLYGINRIQVIFGLSGLTASATDAGNVVVVPGYGLYYWTPAQDQTADGHWVVNDGGSGQWVNVLANQLGWGTGVIVPTAYGVAALTSASQLPVAEVPSFVSALSTSCGAGSYTNATATPTTVTNCSVTIVTTGRPLKLQLVSDGTVGSAGNPNSGFNVLVSSGGASALFQILMDGSTVIATSQAAMHFSSSVADIADMTFPPSVVDHVAFSGITVASHTFAVQASVLAGSGQVQAWYMKLAVYEL